MIVTCCRDDASVNLCRIILLCRRWLGTLLFTSYSCSIVTTSVLVETLVLTSIQDFYDDPINLPKFLPKELIRMTFLKTLPTSDGETIRAKIVHQIMDHDADNHSQIMLKSKSDKVRQTDCRAEI